MFDMFFPLRMAQAATEMAWRNANSAMTMWGQATSQAAPSDATQALYDAPRGITRTSTARSWYRHPDAPVSPSPVMSPMGLMQPWIDLMVKAVPAGSCMMPAMGAGFPGFSALPAPSMALPAPMQAWLKMWSMTPAGMSAGPMAFALMAFGMPRAAAWPAAEAGAHAMEASRKAAEGMEQMFSTYRSNGGHAIAQIIFGGHRLN